MASDQGLHSLLTGNNIRNRIKMTQDTWQPLNDKMTSLIAKDCIFLRKYGLIVSLFVQNGFKSAFLVVLSLPRWRSHYNCVAFATDTTTFFCMSNIITFHVFPASYFAGLRSLAFETNLF